MQPGVCWLMALILSHWERQIRSNRYNGLSWMHVNSAQGSKSYAFMSYSGSVHIIIAPFVFILV